MSARRYVYTRKDGTPSQHVRKIKVLAVAGTRLIKGTGPFTLTRTGWYKHPSLRRGEALRMLSSMLDTVDVTERIDATNRAGDNVLHVKRAQNFVKVIYDNPLRDCVGLRGLRQDQGVDYAVSKDSPVYAIGPGVVTVYRTDTGWPWGAGKNPPSDHGAYIAYRITEGPAKGLLVYDAERITLNPKLKVGSKVDKDTRIATHHPEFAYCEMGWAGADSHYGYGPGDAPEAVNEYDEGERTRAGDNFDMFMRALGAPNGLTEGRKITGSLPAKYPRASEWKRLV